FLQSYCRLLSLPSFPTRRSSDLSVPQRLLPPMLPTATASFPRRSMMETKSYFILSDPSFLLPCGVFFKTDFHEPAYHIFSTISRDRKSTRLNSSHVSISYAVFCL